MKIKTFSFARKNSQRCKNKMLRQFNNTTLVDIALNKLNKINCETFFAGYEKEFEKKCHEHGINFVKRDKNSANIDEPIIDILSFLKKIDADYFIIINSCLPFLKISTINEFINYCIESNFKPTFSISKISNFFIDKNKKPLNFEADLKTINTKKVDPVYQFTHALYFFEKKFFFENGRYWNWNDLNYFEIKDIYETIDIDTEIDFINAEILHKNIIND